MVLSSILKKNRHDPTDDFRIVRTWKEYTDDRKFMKYLMYELEMMEENGNVVHFYKAVKLRREMKRREIDKGSVLFWNTAAGKETKSVILLDDGMLVASGVSSETLVKRFNEIVRGGTKE